MNTPVPPRALPPPSIVTCGPFTGRLPRMARLLELAPSRPAWAGFRGGRIGPVSATLVTDGKKRIVYAVLLVLAALTWLMAHRSEPVLPSSSVLLTVNVVWAAAGPARATRRASAVQM